jgi:hypothetical protein
MIDICHSPVFFLEGLTTRHLPFPSPPWGEEGGFLFPQPTYPRTLRPEGSVHPTIPPPVLPGNALAPESGYSNKPVGMTPRVCGQTLGIPD